MRIAGILLAMAVFSCAGCSSNYALRTNAPEARLQWPFLPQKAKATYLYTLLGFSESGSAVKTLVYGRGAKEANSFILPVAVAVGTDGRMAVADMGRRCVHLYLPAKKRYVRLYGGENTRMSSPVSVVFDDALQIYVSDSAGQILMFESDGTFRSSITRAGAEPLKRPTGLAYSGARKMLFAVDTLAGKVYAFHSGGELAYAFGERGEGNGQFNFPTHIFRSAEGTLYITDSLNFRIAMFDETGAFLGAFGHHGDGSGDLAMPKGVAVDRDGAVYVVDGIFDNVQLFNREGSFLLTIGGRGVDFGEFWLPSGITIDDSGLLYVCDTYNRRVQVFQLTEHYDAGLS